ncbi:hypothetical protein ACIPO9_05760 [Pseudomonas sp. NPDC090203]|uniref:hypothetical protein n=1 Tax=Pseudomonas sp. NPDC090203 TaxID=3364477 RepID=UPI0038136177
MKRISTAALLLLMLCGCTTPGSSVKDKIWYAEKEQPARVPWHVYLMFKDDNHFIWWRTVEGPDAVLKKFDAYTHDNGPGVDSPVSYVRTGDRITAQSRDSVHSKTGETIFTDIRTFDGRFVGDRLEIDYQMTTVRPDRPSTEERVIRWSLKRLSSVGGE